VGIVAVAVVIVVSFTAIAQARVRDPSEPQIPNQITAWLRDRVEPGDRIVMTFRYHELIALELFGAGESPELSAERVVADQSLGDYLWIGLRDRQLFGYRRDSWQAMLAAPGTRYLVLAGPHSLTPTELLPALDAARLPGIRPGAAFEAGNDWARIYSVDSDAVLTVPTEPATHLSANAALAWLDLGGAGSLTDRRQQLIDARPVVVGRGMRRVLDGLGPRACAVPTQEPGRTVRIVSRDEATDEPDAVCGT
jgi:hypothetical protein